MKPIDNARFGKFVAERRKALGLTQLELGERLFVSDKAVSKWERGASLPNIALLQPLAEVLEVSVNELLNGARDAHPIESADRFSLNDLFARTRRRWLLLFVGTCALVLAEILLITVLTVPLSSDAIIMSALCLLFAGWLCLFAQPLLPGYYDENKISFVQQGPFRINMVGMRFTNGNWPYILTFLRILTLLFAMLALPVGALLSFYAEIPRIPVLLIALALIFVPLYIVGKKYE